MLSALDAVAEAQRPYADLEAQEALRLAEQSAMAAYSHAACIREKAHRRCRTKVLAFLIAAELQPADNPLELPQELCAV